MRVGDLSPSEILIMAAQCQDEGTAPPKWIATVLPAAREYVREKELDRVELLVANRIALRTWHGVFMAPKKSIRESRQVIRMKSKTGTKMGSTTILHYGHSARARQHADGRWAAMVYFHQTLHRNADDGVNGQELLGLYMTEREAMDAAKVAMEIHSATRVA